MKSILFSTPMVQAIPDGRKTQTRRVMKPQPDNKDCFRISPHNNDYNRFTMWAKDNWAIIENGEVPHWKCPYGKPGDILWVRETTYLYGRWQRNGFTKTGKQKYKFVWDKSKPVIYAADGKPDDICTGKDEVGYFKRPSIFMPREVARIFLRVTNVRVERLQDITSEQAKNEGVDLSSGTPFPKSTARDCHGAKNGLSMYQSKFVILWDSTIKKQDLDKYSWEANPWVWVYEFERVSEDD